MPLDMHWTITVQVPQLDAVTTALNTWGEQIVEQAQAVKDEIARLTNAQAQGSADIAAQINAILQEMQQYSNGQIPQEQFNNLMTALKTAADTAEQQSADIRANTEQLMQIVPDAPPTP